MGDVQAHPTVALPQSGSNEGLFFSSAAGGKVSRHDNRSDRHIEVESLWAHAGRIGDSPCEQWSASLLDAAAHANSFTEVDVGALNIGHIEGMPFLLAATVVN
jgi:hypothetical protein